jgi:hypothetical protein
MVTDYMLLSCHSQPYTTQNSGFEMFHALQVLIGAMIMHKISLNIRIYHIDARERSQSIAMGIQI